MTAVDDQRRAKRQHDRPWPDGAGRDLLQGLPRHGAGPGQSLGLLSSLGLHRRRALPPRAGLLVQVPAILRSGLFLAGVFLCFFAVLPLTLRFLLEFNVWLGVKPMLRLSEWMGFATILPLVFGLCFQTPLVMLFLSMIGIFTASDYRSKRRMAFLIIPIVAAVLTPGPDVSSMLLLSVPMVLLYELGILLVVKSKGFARG